MIKVIFHYAKDDPTFFRDCYDVEIFVDNVKVDPLPFEEDYPYSAAKVFIEGLIYRSPDEEVVEESVADLDV